MLKAALGFSDEQIDHLEGLGYARDAAQALELVESRAYDAAFFMAPTPVRQVQLVAASGESMPPKSTFFFPKVPTGLVFNPLTGEDCNACLQRSPKAGATIEMSNSQHLEQALRGNQGNHQ